MWIASFTIWITNLGKRTVSFHRSRFAVGRHPFQISFVTFDLCFSFVFVAQIDIFVSKAR